MRATIKDVAKLAGVSTATVSNILTGKKYVGPEVTLRVRQAMETLNYQRNAIARSLKVNRSYNIGLMVPDISNPFFGEIVKFAQQVVNHEGYQITLCDFDNDSKREQKILQTFLSAGVDGIINVAPRMKQSQLGRGLGVPMVVVDRPHFKTDANIAFVYADNYKGAAAVADHFIRKEHRRFACFTGPIDEVPNARMRMDGFLDELKKRGVTESAWRVYPCDFTFESGYQTMETMLKDYDPSQPWSVFVSSDIMAWGAMEAVKSHKMKMPRDIAIVGYDNIYFSEFLYPKLTTVWNPTKDMASTAARMLLDAIDEQEGLGGRYLVVNSMFIERQSG